jgi:hypothetical protein
MDYSKNRSVWNSHAPVAVMYVVQLPATQVIRRPVTHCRLRFEAKDSGILAGNDINREFTGQKQSWFFGFKS